MRKIIFFCLLASACAPRMTSEQISAAESKKCESYGFTQGTKDFSNCMMTVDQNYKQALLQQQQTAAMNTQANAAMIGATSSLTNVGKSNSINCNTRQIGGTANTNCY